MYPLRLAPSWREKIWGSHDLRPLFGRHDHRIGEVWFTFEENTITNGPWAGRTLEQLMARHGTALMGTSCRDPGYFPILIKFLFTSDKLSVQVHPDDAYAREHEDGLGKTEMWYVLRADHGASIALGLTESLSPERLRDAAVTGEIEGYLRWVEVHPGDAIFCPAGTLHSIGPGLALCEIQQNSDITYRFYDFGRLGDDGRPRPLHIDQAVAVTRLESHPGPLEATADTLARCEHFSVERLRRAEVSMYRTDPARMHLLVFLEGRGALEGESYRPGDVYLLPATLGSFEWHPLEPTLALRASVP
jgi:mannose-6-phosphate isomerase